MSKLYSIQESTLTNIGNALRSKYGETRPETTQVPYVIAKSSNATSFTSFEGLLTATNECNVIRFPGATTIKITFTHQFHNENYGYIQFASGNYDLDTFPYSSVTKYSGNRFVKPLVPQDLIMNNTDTITIYYYVASFISTATGNYLGYYAECVGYDADGKPIEVEGCSYKEQEIEVPNTYSSADVAAAIEGLSAAPEPIILSGNQNYIASGPISSNYIKRFGNTITTNDITSTRSMFQNYEGEFIPFEINGKISNSYCSINKMFYDAKNLKQVPKMNTIKPDVTDEIFYGCYSLRYLPEDIANWFDWSYITSHTSSTYGARDYMFYDCYSLRSIPMDFLKPNNSNARYSNAIYYNGFSDCYSLDELVGLPVPYTGTWTNNAFSSTFFNDFRLKRIVFETNEDGSPKVVNWKNQIIDLTNSTGCVTMSGKPYILNYNSGITADKEVKDDATYQALKDDPDWFTTNIAYSRYNHDSAVATINSLPDASAYLTANGGTNTIKFKGEAGSATDGGAINTLTEEEIAVAAAKGWTVSFT